jgi:hypothetical protein
VARGLLSLTAREIMKKTDLPTVSLDQLAAVSGGISWGSIWNSIRPQLPPNGPTIPLGPYYPPKNDPRIA